MFSSRACCEGKGNVPNNVNDLKYIIINEVSNRSYDLGIHLTCQLSSLCDPDISYYFLPIFSDEKTKAQRS